MAHNQGQLALSEVFIRQVALSGFEMFVAWMKIFVQVDSRKLHFSEMRPNMVGVCPTTIEQSSPMKPAMTNMAISKFENPELSTGRHS